MPKWAVQIQAKELFIEEAIGSKHLLMIPCRTPLYEPVMSLEGRFPCSATMLWGSLKGEAGHRVDLVLMALSKALEAEGVKKTHSLSLGQKSNLRTK